MHVPSSTEYTVLNGCCFCFSQSTVTTSCKVPLLITLHGGRGFGQHGGDFNAFLPLANEGTLRILSYDQRGHGQSEVVGPFTFDQLVQDVEAFRKAFVEGETPFVLLGGSFGGFIAQQYAITYPHHLYRLVLRGTAPSYHTEDDAREVLRSRLYRVPSASPGMLDKIFSSVDNDMEFRLIVFALAPLYVETYDADAGLKSHVEGIYRAKVHNDLYSEREKYFDYTDHLVNLKVKSLILVGEFDWICPPRQAKKIHELVSTSELFVVKGANHSCHLEKNEVVLGKLKLFLEDILQP
ncbi:alpha/beta-hydrolase [Atractiella rhizophila]|nr:alpha/beta-hydrolase [Atractiella rhizophila]